jgi:hypothetical protein
MDPGPGSRNALCACGSGKKAKRCCLSPAALAEARRVAEEDERAERQRRHDEVLGRKSGSTVLAMTVLMANVGMA